MAALRNHTGMRAIFGVYLVGIVATIGYFVVIGLSHH